MRPRRFRGAPPMGAQRAAHRLEIPVNREGEWRHHQNGRAHDQCCVTDTATKAPARSTMLGSSPGTSSSARSRMTLRWLSGSSGVKTRMFQSSCSRTHSSRLGGQRRCGMGGLPIKPRTRHLLRSVAGLRVPEPVAGRHVDPCSLSPRAARRAPHGGARAEPGHCRVTML